MRRVARIALSWMLLAWAAAATLATGRARAGEPDRAALEEAARSADAATAASALYALAEADDAAGDYARALDEYRASVARLPSHRYAARAATRAAQLAAHAEGGFAPLARLDEVRRDPAKGSDPAAIDALARDAERFPPGAVRAEARMLCAEAYLRRLARTADAIAELHRALDDPSTDALTRRQAAQELVDARVREGDLDGARAEAARYAAALDPSVIARLRELVRRRALHRIAIGVLAVFVAFAAASIVAAARRDEAKAILGALRVTSPSALAFCAYLAAAGGALASAYERGNAAPFVALGAAVLPIVLVARAWGAAGSRAAPARIARAIVGGASVVAAGFLLLEAIDAAYLEGFGL